MSVHCKFYSTQHLHIEKDTLHLIQIRLHIAKGTVHFIPMRHQQKVHCRFYRNPLVVAHWTWAELLNKGK